jgi:transcription elongation factor GreA
MADTVPMTKAGHAAMEKELERLVSTERRQIVKEIEVARGHGDLSENAEYHAAKEKQGLIEAKIRDMQHKLAHAQVVDPLQVTAERVAFGATVRLLNTETDEELVYQIVGEDEADHKIGKISFKSPIARAMIGKEEADDIRVRTPGGIRLFEILEIRYE